MKRKIFSFIRPSLTLLDNGKFFRKPFGWVYAAIAILSLLAPLFLVYCAVWWNITYQKKVECQKVYQEVALPQYQKLQIVHDTLVQEVDRYSKEMNNAIECLSRATKQADYYGEYTSYGPDYKQIYANALDVKRQWDEVYKYTVQRWDSANAVMEVLKPKYNRVKLNFNKAETELTAANEDFQLIDQFGTVFKKNEAKDGNTIVALVLFSLMIVLVGVLNFLLWWNRMLALKNLSKVHDTFVATPLASHFIQTFGESMGFTISIWGFFTALIYFTCRVNMGQFGLNYTDLGIFSIFLPIVLGFLIIFIFRIMAELLKAVVAIANNSDE